MSERPSHLDFERISKGFSKDPAASYSLQAEAYTDAQWMDLERDAIFRRSWQWVCHAEKLRAPGAYVTVDVAGQPICIVRDQEGGLSAFYNVCKHRAHELLRGEGTASRIMCPYHAWVYDLTGQLRRAPETESLVDFNVGDICLDRVQVEEFCGFVYVNLDADAAPLAEQSGSLAKEIMHWAPDVERADLRPPPDL